MLEVAVECALAGHHPSSPALVVESDRPRTMSYGELRTTVERLRVQLRVLGVRPGCVLMLHTARTPEAVAVTLAAVAEGAVFCHHETQYGRAQLLRALKESRATALIVDDHGVSDFEHDAELLLGLQPVYLPPYPDGVPSSALAGGLPCLSLGDPGAATGLRGREAHRVSSGAGTLCFTSGSTGTPKSILLPGYSYVANAISDAAIYGMSPRDKILHMLSLGHSYGIIQMFSTLLAGAALHLLDYFIFRKQDWVRLVSRSVARAQITGFHCGASLFFTLADSAQAPLFAEGTSLRFISLAGAPLAPAQLDRLSQVIPSSVAIYKEYGQGEVSRIAILHASDPANRERLASVGRAIPGNRIFVTKDRQTVAASAEPGEIAVISPTRAMLGYLGDEAQTRDHLAVHPAFPGERVVYTGDQGYLDEDGNLFVIGRRSGVFKRNWVLIYPDVVESDLLRHEDIVEAVVFGVEVTNAAQPGRTVAIVVTRTAIDPSALIGWATQQLPPSSVPDDLRIWKELPRTASGKLARFEIRRRYLGEQCPWSPASEASQLLPEELDSP